MVLQEAKTNDKIIITGLLARGLQPSIHRVQVAEVNRCLEVICAKDYLRNVFYLNPDKDWILPNGTLDESYYFRDYLHLVGK